MDSWKSIILTYNYLMITLKHTSEFLMHDLAVFEFY